MDPIETIGPDKEIMGFFKDYMLKGVKNLDANERAIYQELLKGLVMPKYVVDDSKINMQDLVNIHKPGAIVRRRT